MTDVVSILHPIVTVILAIAAIYQTFKKGNGEKKNIADDLIALRLQDLQDIKVRLSVLEERTSKKK